MVKTSLRKKETDKVDFLISRDEEGGKGRFKFLRGDKTSDGGNIQELLIKGNKVVGVENIKKGIQ